MSHDERVVPFADAEALEMVLDLADTVTVLDFGRKIAAGAPAATLRVPEVVAAYLGTAPGADDLVKGESS
jgi:branched-chain amino acid transport system ATP-binding protein